MFPRIGVVLLVPALWLAGSATRAQEPCGVPEGPGPRIEAATPVVVRSEGTTVCACGAFPDRAALEGLRIDGQPVEASVDVFGRVATLRLPPGLEPGVHALSGDPEAGYSPTDRVEFQLVAVETRRCEHFYSCGKHRRVCLTVEGSEEPLALRVRNRNPELVAFPLGPAGEVKTSGGSRNRKVIEGRATGAPGHWTLDITPAGPPCPCAVGGEEGLPPARVAELEACLQAAVAVIEAWFDGRARELAARAALGTLTAGDVIALIDELERRLLRVLATPDLAALRAWVEDELGRERDLWSRAPAGAVPAAARATSGYALAAGGGPSAPQPILRAQAEASQGFDAFWGRIKAFFGDLTSVSNNLVVDLCVRSDRARESWLWLYPKRYPHGKRGSESDGIVARVSRGLYCMVVTKPAVSWETIEGGAQSPECIESSRVGLGAVEWAQAAVDLVDESGQYYTCNLTSSDNAARTCVKDPIPPGSRCVRLSK
jgi:hypothetical protein